MGATVGRARAADDYFVFKKVKAEISGYPAKVVAAELVSCPAACPAK